MKPAGLDYWFFQHRWLAWLVGGLGVFLAVMIGVNRGLEMHGFPETGIDDANIFFTYAENLAGGYGPTYGAEHLRVEGYSSLLWMLLCGGVFRLGGREPQLLLLCSLLTAVVMTLSLGFVHRWVRGRFRWMWGVFFLYALFAYPAFLFWNTLTLMDNALWTSGLLLLFWVLHPFTLTNPKTKRLCIWMAVLWASLIRPEALLIIPVFGIAVLLLTPKTELRRISRCLHTLTAFVVAQTLLLVWRLAYYGHPFPNTYYAKVSPVISFRLREGFAYFLDYYSSAPLISLSICTLWIPGFLWLKRVRSPDPKTVSHALLTAFSGLLLLIPIWNGGDHFVMHRFYQCATPFLYLHLTLLGHAAFSAVLRRIPAGATPRRREVLLCLASAVLVAFLATPPQHSWSRLRKFSSPLQIEFDIARDGLEQGQRLNELFAELDTAPVLGVVIAGGIAREYQGPIVDLMGLNHEKIAHTPGRKVGVKNHAAFRQAFFWEYPVDVLMAKQQDVFYHRVLDGLLMSPRFREEWSFVHFQMPGQERGFYFFVTNTLLNQIRDRPGIQEFPR